MDGDVAFLNLHNGLLTDQSTNGETPTFRPRLTTPHSRPASQDDASRVVASPRVRQWE